MYKHGEKNHVCSRECKMMNKESHKKLHDEMRQESEKERTEIKNVKVPKK
jgi:hypothetical protein